jgi:hypothetical protein
MRSGAQPTKNSIRDQREAKKRLGILGKTWAKGLEMF